MAATLPIKTTGEDIDKLLAFLATRPGWVEVTEIKSNLAIVGDTRKINTLHFLGIVDRDAGNVKLTASGRALAKSSGEKRTELFTEHIRRTGLYHRTLEWIYWQKLESPTKVDIASRWMEEEASVKGAAEGLVTDGVITFSRIAELGGLGKFISAGGTREARFDIDAGALEAYYRGSGTEGTTTTEGDHTDSTPIEAPAAPPAETSRPPTVTLEPGVRINIEIHIAADSTPETVEEIFKNMRKYVLSEPETEAE